MDIATSMADSFVEELYRVSLNEPEEAVAAPLLQDYSTPALEASRVRWRAVMTNGIITRWEKMGPPTPPTDPGSVAAPSASAPAISAAAAASSAGPKVKPPMRGSVALTPSVPAAVLQKRFQMATTAAQAEELARRKPGVNPPTIMVTCFSGRENDNTGLVLETSHVKSYIDRHIPLIAPRRCVAATFCVGESSPEGGSRPPSRPCQRLATRRCQA